MSKSMKFRLIDRMADEGSGFELLLVPIEDDVTGWVKWYPDNFTKFGDAGLLKFVSSETYISADHYSVSPRRALLEIVEINPQQLEGFNFMETDRKK